MEIVHTLDIDGSQWVLQDVEARNRIATLETEVNTNIPNRFEVDENKVNGIYKIANGNSIQECCTKLKYSYVFTDIPYAIDYVFRNPESYPTGIYSITVGGPAFLFMVQNLDNNYMSVIATGYSTSDIFKANKNDTNYTLGIISKTSVV